jgi:hypothetical protein
VAVKVPSIFVVAIRISSGTKPADGSRTVSAWLGHTRLDTTAKYLDVTTQYLHELDDRVPLTLVNVSHMNVVQILRQAAGPNAMTIG